ncbi:MAG TPA: aldo/keto reductase [Ramlibacter sp.]|uniref:aldo/keto reductase n=1 Tax=Ramlibacter sp. TaxID=1917967 RepID=UPI002CBA4257|nr:aldo/keto reductase [Ramlibacter sp.]HVZ43595.1 aldo/keto reductase [Ramlibacter sp.]
MQRVRLGRTGLQVSRLCVGTMTFGTQANEGEAFAILDACAEAGVDFIDSADIYPLGSSGELRGETERIIGKWLKDRRERFIVATKGGSDMGRLPWQGGTSRKHLLSAIDDSLKRLQTDYVDLYQLHRDDASTPLDETLEALDTIVKSGRARYVGLSNWSAWRTARALGRSEALRIANAVSVQPRYNLLFRQFERDLFPMCEEEGLATLCYNPLAGGLLTGKHRDLSAPDAGTRFTVGGAAQMYRDRYWHEREFEAVTRFVALANEAGIAPVRLAVAWVLAQRGVTCAIIGASRASQLADSLASVEVRIDAELMRKLDEMSREFRFGDAVR